MTEARRILLEARDLIQRGWTQGTDARDSDGRKVAPSDEAATCWCLIGAMLRVRGSHNTPFFDRAVDVLYWAPPCKSTFGALCQWNDEADRTKDDVIARIDRAVQDLVVREARNKL